MTGGLTIIYWGYGKGKSTAAIGLALRALGQGQRVLFMQFMKGGKEAGWETGEGKMLKKLREQGEQIEFRVVGKGWVRIMGDKKPIEDHEQSAREGLEFVKNQFVIAGGSASETSEAEPPHVDQKFNVIILDEILSAVDSALLSVDDIKDLIAAKPPEVHLLMTGHSEYPELAELADLVTKMEKVKHPYDTGVLAQRGVDF